ncbi:hybrid sensor histidine kinase/response regulator [Nitrosovibrio sp. Nv4]|uniref:hybrid sensor histidine kinase/response regulator n=1 Tax=Nitrosovibrio sp. Nv4 TaxID=1945880 RepID=UPI000BCC2872|nr:response regulator [Nitrosovibrio sp. Nv4]SOD41092.1 CheA signal transduction histidine kinase [Nitrosovibrio sp. Nv4]
MVDKNDEFLGKLLATFRIEADAHLHAMASGLLVLEKTPVAEQRDTIVEMIFRAAHSLKGAARVVNLTQVEAVCRSLENVLSAMKDKRLAISSQLVDLLLRATDVLAELLAVEGNSAGVNKPLLTALVRQLDGALTRPLPPSAAPASAIQTVPPALYASAAGSDDHSAAHVSGTVPSAAPTPASATIRVAADKLDAVMGQVEELLLPRLAAGQRVQELSEATAILAAWKKQQLKIQPVLRAIDRELTHNLKISTGFRLAHELTRLLKYLDAEQTQMKVLEDQLEKLQCAADQDHRALATIIDSLRRDIKEMQLLPFSSLLKILPRFSRELAREQGKSLELMIQGGELEIDRQILEEMKDPLIHLVRNCIDHGIEQPAVRVSKGKPAKGTITLACSQKDSSTAEVIVADDGAGIDLSMIKEAACRLDVVSTEEAEQLDEVGATALAFQSGVSTRSIITDISGRGLGLAIVREKVESLGGRIIAKSSPDSGTSFHILLPLTRANFRGVLVHAGGQLFVIPSTSIERVVRIGVTEIRTVENSATILVDEQAVSLVWLSDVLELPRQTAEVGPMKSAAAVVLGSGLVRLAFLVEEILGEQEVLVKALARPLIRIRNIAGASVLGSGEVAPVLNVADLLRSAVKRPAAAATFAAQLSDRADERIKKLSILVVEDSITSRILLKNILESAGYRVGTAVDGADAYRTVKTDTFDLVVSDVEMPRMNGFDLTARIRADEQLTALPVVLVTALESREHRERGIDAGANAYIVKSSFDQSNLLEVIQRLIGTPA